MAKGHFFLGLVIGSAAAIGAALFLTPETADDLRKHAANNRDKMKDRATELYQIADDATADWREDAAKKVNSVLNEHEGLHSAMDTSGQAFQQMKDNFQDATAQMKSQFGDVTDQLKSSFEQTKDSVNESNDFDDIVLDSQSAFQEAQDEDDTIAYKAEDLADKADDTLADIKETVADNDTVAEVKDNAAAAQDQLKEVSDQAKEKADEVKDDLTK